MIVKCCGEINQKIIIDKYEKILIEQDDCIILEVLNEKRIVVKSEPFFSDSEPCVGYYSLLEIVQNNFTCDNSNVIITKYPNNIYKIYFKKLKITQKNPPNIAFDGRLLDTSLQLTNTFPQKLKMEKNSKKYEIILQKYVKNATFSEYNGHILLKGDIENNEKYCGIFGINGEILAEIIGDAIEITPSNITSLQKLKDVNGLGYVCEYNLDKEGVTLGNSYTVYMEQKAKLPANDYAICWAYVEALNIGNLKLARSFLSDELNDLLSDNHIWEYFGNYSEMEQNWISENQNIIWVISRDSKVAKGYVFEIKNKKICNIDTI